MSRSSVTRSFYRWEEDSIPNGRDLTEREAQRLARRVWTWARSNPRYARRAFKWRCPDVMFGKGVKQANRYLSYCEGYLKIVLAPGQRNECVVLHEMTHALGPITHDKRFQQLYLTLILRFMF